MVFDKEGRFVGNLKPLQFELLLTASSKRFFFERVKAGTASEERSLRRRAAQSAQTSTGQTLSIRWIAVGASSFR